MTNRYVPGVVVVALLVAVAVVVIVLAGGEEEEWQPGTLAGSTLERLTQGGSDLGRAEFAVCVDGAAGETVGGSDVRMVLEALESALASSPEIPYRVDQGCPPPVGLTGRALDERERQFSDMPSRFLASPESASPYSLAVYFVPGDIYASSFEDAVPYAIGTEERFCSGDICGGVTAGLYVTSSTTQEEVLYAILELYGAVPDRFDVCTGSLSPEPAWCEEYREDVGLDQPAS